MGRSCEYGIMDTYMIDFVKAFTTSYPGCIFVLQDFCDANFKLISPVNGVLHVPLGQSSNGFHPIDLKWDFRNNLNFFKSILYVSTDSMFLNKSEYNVDAYNKSLSINHLFPGKTYYWKVGLQDCMINDTNWSPPWKFTTSRASLNGFVFEDVYKNGHYEEFIGKQLPNWPL